MNEKRVSVPEFEIASCPTVNLNEIKDVHYDLGHVPIRRVRWWHFIQRFQIWRYGRAMKKVFRKFTIQEIPNIDNKEKI